MFTKPEQARVKELQSNSRAKEQFMQCSIRSQIEKEFYALNSDAWLAALETTPLHLVTDKTIDTPINRFNARILERIDMAMKLFEMPIR